MSLRFLKREAKLCGFLQKSFQTLEKVGPQGRCRAGDPAAQLLPLTERPLQRMKVTETMRLKAEDSLREELDKRWQKLQELDEAHLQALREQWEVEHPWGCCGSGRAEGQR